MRLFARCYVVTFMEDQIHGRQRVFILEGCLALFLKYQAGIAFKRVERRASLANSAQSWRVNHLR